MAKIADSKALDGSGAPGIIASSESLETSENHDDSKSSKILAISDSSSDSQDSDVQMLVISHAPNTSQDSDTGNIADTVPNTGNPIDVNTSTNTTGNATGDTTNTTNGIGFLVADDFVRAIAIAWILLKLF